MSLAPETGLAGPGILPLSPRATRGGSTARALRDSEAKYRRLLDGVQDHAIFMLDPPGLIVSWNAEEQTMRVRRDGSRFLTNVTITALRDPPGALRLDKQA